MQMYKCIWSCEQHNGERPVQDCAKQLSCFDDPDFYQLDRIIRGFRREQLSSRHLETQTEDVVIDDRRYSFVNDRRKKENLLVKLAPL